MLEILLEKDPAKRFQTPDDLITAIAGVKAAVTSGYRLSKEKLRRTVHGEIEWRPDPSWCLARRKDLKHKLALYVTGVLVISALPLGLLYSDLVHSSSPPPTHKTSQPTIC